MKINDMKAGDEYFTPHFNASPQVAVVQTYELRSYYARAITGRRSALATGYTKAASGHFKELYGSEFALLCEIWVTHADGTLEVLKSDKEWTAERSRVQSGKLHDGKVYDATFTAMESYAVCEFELNFERLMERLSLPVWSRKS